MSDREMNKEFEKFQEHIQIKPKEPEINPEKPWEGDAFERSELAEKLIRLIQGTTTPLVISVDGAWGSGKTFFLKRLEADLKNKDFETIYFNAWEDDFHSDPLVAMLGRLYNNFYRKGFIRIVNKLKKNGGKVLQSAVLDKLKRTTGMDLEKNLRTVEEKIFSQYVEHQKTKESLKSNLHELAVKSRENTNQPLVFIIDELDRCRPTFAIELLERVKHIFDVERIVFILGIDKGQLEKSVCSVYGKINSEIYLRRFFDLDFSLPKPNLKQFFEFLISRYQLIPILEYLSRASKSSEDGRIHTGDLKILTSRLPQLVSYFDLSLRDIDSVMRSLIFIIKTCKDGYSFLPFLVIPLLLIRLEKRELYEGIIQGTINPMEGYDFINDKIRSDSEATLDRNFWDTCQVIQASFYLLHPSEKWREVQKQMNILIGTDHAKSDLELLSKGIRESKDKEEEVRQVRQYMENINVRDPSHLDLKYVRQLIDLA